VGGNGLQRIDVTSRASGGECGVSELVHSEKDGFYFLFYYPSVIAVYLQDFVSATPEAKSCCVLGSRLEAHEPVLLALDVP